MNENDSEGRWTMVPRWREQGGGSTSSSSTSIDADTPQQQLRHNGALPLAFYFILQQRVAPLPRSLTHYIIFYFIFYIFT
jgi:hypothetical protein